MNIIHLIIKIGHSFGHFLKKNLEMNSISVEIPQGLSVELVVAGPVNTSPSYIYHSVITTMIMRAWRLSYHV